MLVLHTRHTDNKNILFSIFSIMIYRQYKKLISACVYLYFWKLSSYLVTLNKFFFTLLKGISSTIAAILWFHYYQWASIFMDSVKFKVSRFVNSWKVYKLPTTFLWCFLTFILRFILMKKTMKIAFHQMMMKLRNFFIVILTTPTD